MGSPIAIANRQRQARVSAPRLRKLAAWLMAQATALRPELAGGPLSIALVDDAGIAPVNEQFVHHHGPTDVISFRYDPLPGCADAPAELVVNVQRAVLEARRRGRPVGHELALYLAHGCLHLTGADDATPAQRARMQRVQNGWLRRATKDGLLDQLIAE